MISMWEDFLLRNDRSRRPSYPWKDHLFLNSIFLHSEGSWGTDRSQKENLLKTRLVQIPEEAPPTLGILS